MEAEVLIQLGTARANALAVARQEWRLVRQHYDKLLDAYPALPYATRTQMLRAASERKSEAFDLYMKMLGSDY